MGRVLGVLTRFFDSSDTTSGSFFNIHYLFSFVFTRDWARVMRKVWVAVFVRDNFHRLESQVTSSFTLATFGGLGFWMWHIVYSITKFQKFAIGFSSQTIAQEREMVKFWAIYVFLAFSGTIRP
jgi:hypothetical protein